MYFSNPLYVKRLQISIRPSIPARVWKKVAKWWLRYDVC